MFDDIAAALDGPGFAVVAHALPEGLLAALLERSRRIDESDFERAGVGRENDHRVNRFVRGDWIWWPPRDDAATAGYLAWIERLRLALNRRLFLGLFDFECHYACYPPGAFYRRHVDAFRGGTNRVVSTVLYLNPDWVPGHGGELLLFEGESASPIERVAPVLGTLAIFLSEAFPHEVLPAVRPRYSLTGWFRVNGSIGGVVDPPR